MRGKINDLLNSRQEAPPQQEPQKDPFAEAEIKNTRPLKLNNAKSSIKPTPSPIDIKEAAVRILNNEEEQKKIAWDLTSKLIGLFKDHTLNENKDPKVREAENKIMSDYVEFARLINTSDKEEDSLGSLSFTIAVLRGALIQRDRLNELEYELFQIKKLLESK